MNLASARAHAPSSPQLAIAEAGAASAEFDRVGATVLADTAAALLRSLGVARRSVPRSGAELTMREQEVMHLVGLGLSNPEIAQRLFISRKTAAHHVSSVLGKLGLRNRAEAVAHVARLADHHRSS
ncbi:helix-turn-helix domain-containing protein [Pseudonocardia saturnea]